MKTISIFVDVHSLYSVVGKKFEGKKLDYGKYAVKAAGDDFVYRAFAYGYHKQTEAAKFISCLKYFGFEPKYRQLETRNFRYNWNVGIAMDVVRLIDKTDTVVLGSSDKNLIPLVQWIQEHGTRCVIFSCCIPKELREVADDCIEISEELLEE